MNDFQISSTPPSTPALQAEIDRLMAENEKLREWKKTVTAAAKAAEKEFERMWNGKAAHLYKLIVGRA